MSDKTKIEWSDATWNPVTGCTKVSEGCRNCYALTFAERWRGTPGHYFENGFDITLRPDKLDQPLKWKRPRKIFVNSMSDLFHEGVSFDYIASVWRVMATAHWHTFQLLTKRPQRMLEFTSWMAGQDDISVAEWPRNVWLGVSVENQKAADERIPLLLQTPAAVRFLSCEPLLGPVDLRNVDYERMVKIDSLTGLHGWPYPHAEQEKRIDWVIAGGESGPGARPMHPDWARALRDQCQAACVPFLFKQWGEWAEANCADDAFLRRQLAAIDSSGARHNKTPHADLPEDVVMLSRFGKHNTGRELDGRTWNEYPEAQA